MVVGLLGYGISLVLFVLALRDLGNARTGAYCSVAPFMGALVSLAWLGKSVDSAFWIACALMGWGVWLHLAERHEHEHTREAMEYSHAYVHDDHHQHLHGIDWDGQAPHVHAHFPDIHHRHVH